MAPFGASRAGLMSVAVDDIPDSEILQARYDPSELGTGSYDEIPDLQNDYDLTGTSINVVDDGRMTSPFFDADNDQLTNDDIQMSLPFTMCMVLEVDGPTSDNVPGYTHQDSTGYFATYTDSDWRIRGNETLNMRDPVDEVVVGIAHFTESSEDDTAILFDGDEKERTDGDAGSSDDPEGFEFGAVNGGDNWDGGIGETLLYDGKPDFDDVIDYLGRWIP